MATPRWGGLRLEPYNANAVDADGDGIVQEGTAWERPGATTLVDNLGRAIRDGVTSTTRPQGMRVLDSDGKEVKYKPTYGTGPTPAQAPGAGKQTPLAEHGAPSLREMGVLSLKDMGLPTVQQIAARRNQPVAPEPMREDQTLNRSLVSPVPMLIDATRVDASVPTPESFEEFENYIQANFDDIEVGSPEWFDEVNNWLRDTMIPSGKWSEAVQIQIDNYRARWYIGINDGLRRGESNPDPEMQEYLMSSKLPEGLTIYRGTSYWDEDAPYLDEGDTFTDRAFQSFSAKPRDLATEGVGRLSDIQIVATLGPNVRGANIGGFENEVLLPAGIKYRIDEITEDERGKPIWKVTILEQGEGIDFEGAGASVSTDPEQEKPSYNLPIIPGQVLPTQMFDEPNMEKVDELIRSTSDVDQQLQRMVATAFYTNDFSWILDQIAIDATSNSELGGDPIPVEGVSLADIRFLAEMWRNDAQRGLERIADEDGMITVYRGGRVGGIEHGPVSVSLNKETASEYGDPIEYRIPISAVEYEPWPNDYEELVVNPSLMTPVNREGEQKLQEAKDNPLSYPKPRYPRQPPASAFSGRAEELFGSAKSWDEFKQLLDENEVIFLDYETTGLDWDEFGQVRSNGEPTQIGAVKMRGGQIVDRFNIYINPAVPHAEWQEWSRLNLRDADGNLITQQFLEDKPSIKEAHDLFTQWAGPNAILGMQNAIFDDEILTRSLVAGGNDWRPVGILDTKEIADMALPKWNPDSKDGPIKHDELGNVVLDANGNPLPSNSLGDITRYLGVDLGEKHHTADYDAIATGEVLSRLVDGAIEKGWSTDVLDSTKRRAKEKANQDGYDKAISQFLEDVKAYKAQNRPTWGSVSKILDWDVFGFGEMSDEDKEADGLFEVWNETLDDWNLWDPCREMRRSAYDLAGLSPGPADPNLGRVGGFFGNGWQTQVDDGKRVEQARYLMASVADAVNEADPDDSPTIYRAVALGSGEEDAFYKMLKPGQQVDIPLLAFADRRAQGDNEYLTRYGSDALLVLEESPGSVSAGTFPPMYDSTNEREMLDTLSDVLDEMEVNAEPEEEGYVADLVMNVRDLLDRYEATSIAQRDERQALREQIAQAIEDSAPGLPVRWAGSEIPEEDASLYWAGFDDPDANVGNTPRERISGGRLEVIAVEDDPFGTYKKIVRLRQVAAFDPQQPGRLIGRKP